MLLNLFADNKPNLSVTAHWTVSLHAVWNLDTAELEKIDFRPGPIEERPHFSGRKLRKTTRRPYRQRPTSSDKAYGRYCLPLHGVGFGGEPTTARYQLEVARSLLALFIVS